MSWNNVGSGDKSHLVLNKHYSFTNVFDTFQWKNRYYGPTVYWYYGFFICVLLLFIMLYFLDFHSSGFISPLMRHLSFTSAYSAINKDNNKIPKHRAIFQREDKTHKFTNRQNQLTAGKLKTVMTLTWYRHFQRNGGLNQILRRQTSRFHYG